MVYGFLLFWVLDFCLECMQWRKTRHEEGSTSLYQESFRVISYRHLSDNYEIAAQFKSTRTSAIVTRLIKECLS